MSQPHLLRLRFLILAGVAAILLSGCQTARWSPTAGTYEPARNPAYSVELPAGWMRNNQAARGDLVLTRDGFLLQQVTVEQRPLGRALPNTRQTLSATMLPHEVAAVLVDNLRGDTGLLQFTLLKDEPRMISGRPGFQFSYEYATREGLKVRGVQAGFVEEGTLWSFAYHAPRRHYFDRYLGDFELILETFQLKAGRPAANVAAKD
jgi:hypothetical protein